MNGPKIEKLNPDRAYKLCIFPEYSARYLDISAETRNLLKPLFYHERHTMKHHLENSDPSTLHLEIRGRA